MLKSLKPMIPAYRLAQQKRELEKYLRSQGWTRKEAMAEVAKKYPPSEARANLTPEGIDADVLRACEPLPKRNHEDESPRHP